MLRRLYFGWDGNLMKVRKRGLEEDHRGFISMHYPGILKTMGKV
jgi:hypothetical protein